MKPTFIKIRELASAPGRPGRQPRSVATILRAVRDGLLTRPVQLGPKITAWPIAEIETLETARIGGADDAQMRALVDRLHAARTAALQSIAPDAGAPPAKRGRGRPRKVPPPFALPSLAEGGRHE